VIVNSKFTKSWVDKEYPITSIVVYPPINTSNFKPKRKQNLILYVGRFSQLEQNKNQDVLLEAFINFYKYHRDWKLILAGGSEVGRTDYVDKLMSRAKGKHVEIIESPSFETIKDLFARASLFWSATGYGVDVQKEPHKAEHFGITVVEAMSAKAIPVIFNGGGHKEIITHGKNGLLWNTPDGLVKSTEVLINNKKTLVSMAKQAQLASKKYDYENFKKQILALL
jgi:glycosyltransferase involved in cell wall biosynthesis